MSEGEKQPFVDKALEAKAVYEVISAELLIFFYKEKPNTAVTF